MSLLAAAIPAFFAFVITLGVLALTIGGGPGTITAAAVVGIGVGIYVVNKMDKGK